MAYRRRKSRRFRRSKSTATKALRLARQVSRQMAGEIKKYDTQALLSQSNFVAWGQKGYVFFIDIVDNQLGTANANFIGNQIRLKYLYLNLRFVLPKDAGTGTDRQAMWRILIVQDTSQIADAVSNTLLVQSLFGYAPESNPDFAVLPLNPMQPGRYRILDDSFVRLSDGSNQDYMYRRYFYQNRFASQGRIYYGAYTNSSNLANTGRNHVYALVMYVPPYINDGTEQGPSFRVQNYSLSYMSRMAYYDN